MLASTTLVLNTIPATLPLFHWRAHFCLHIPVRPTGDRHRPFLDLLTVERITAYSSQRRAAIAVLEDTKNCIISSSFARHKLLHTLRLKVRLKHPTRQLQLAIANCWLENCARCPEAYQLYTATHGGICTSLTSMAQ